MGLVMGFFEEVDIICSNEAEVERGESFTKSGFTRRWASRPKLWISMK